MTELVLDASAILAVYNREPGGSAVQAAARGALVSAVNHAEATSRLVRGGQTMDVARSLRADLGYRVVPFDELQAIECARLIRFTHDAGLSLADRACLALAKLRGLEIMTADRAWTKLQIGVTIRTIR